MKKGLIVVFIVAVVLILAVGCGPTESGKEMVTGNLEDLSPITITLAHGEAGDPTNYIHGASLAFKEYVEEKQTEK